MTRILDVSGATSTTAVVCTRCRLRVHYPVEDRSVVADLLASHWFDDLHLGQLSGPGDRGP